MRLNDIPLFAMLKGRMDYLGARQRVIAENVANTDTPGFTPRDIKPGSSASFNDALNSARGAGGVSMIATQAGHIQGGRSAHAPTPYKPERAPDSETRLDGNSVVLEEQMLKMAESRMAYDAAISFYQKSLNMLRLASKGPGR